MEENPRISRSCEGLFNYMNLNLFCNRFGVLLCDYERSQQKPENFRSFCKTMNDLFDKFMNWSPEPKYSSLVNHLLQSEEEYQVFAQSLKDLSKKKTITGFPRKTIEKLSQDINRIENAVTITKTAKESIDRVVDFLTILSDYTIVSQDLNSSVPYNQDKPVSILLE